MLKEIAILEKVLSEFSEDQKQVVGKFTTELEVKYDSVESEEDKTLLLYAMSLFSLRKSVDEG